MSNIYNNEENGSNVPSPSYGRLREADDAYYMSGGEIGDATDMPFKTEQVSPSTDRFSLPPKQKVSNKWKTSTYALGAGMLIMGLAFLILVVSSGGSGSSSAQAIKSDLYEVLDCEGIGSAGVSELLLNPASLNKTEAYCTEDGWTVIQSRGQFGNPKDYFYRGWAEYAAGFGVPGKEHWLGLNNMYYVTNARKYKLRIKLTDVDGDAREYNYGKFKIMNQEKFNLFAEDYSGPVGEDSLAYHNGIPFTTNDRNNDVDVNNCATHHMSAWWFVACFHANLNGMNYHNEDTTDIDNGYGMAWRGWRGDHHSLRTIQMAIKQSRD